MTAEEIDKLYKDIFKPWTKYVEVPKFNQSASELMCLAKMSYDKGRKQGLEEALKTLEENKDILTHFKTDNPLYLKGLNDAMEVAIGALNIEFLRKV